MSLVKQTAYHSLIAAALIGSVGLPLLVSAQGLGNTTTCPGIVTLIGRIAGVAATLIFALSVLILLYAAFLFLTGGGNPERVTTARTYLIYAIVGLVVALLAFNFPTLIKTLVGGSLSSCGDAQISI